MNLNVNAFRCITPGLEYAIRAVYAVLKALPPDQRRHVVGAALLRLEGSAEEFTVHGSRFTVGAELSGSGTVNREL